MDQMLWRTSHPVRLERSPVLRTKPTLETEPTNPGSGMRSCRANIALLALALAACDIVGASDSALPPDGTIVVDLQTDRAAYHLAASATITMTNRSADTLLIGACDDVLERDTGTRWVEVPPLQVACPAIGLLLDPQVPMTLPFDLRSATQPGLYRHRRSFSNWRGPASEKSYRRSNSFALIE